MPDLISPTRLPHTATRSAELYLKRQTFRVENAAVLRLQTLYGAAYDDIMAIVRQAAGSRAYAEPLIALRLARLKAAVLADIAATAKASALGGYYGRLWLLDMATHDSLPINAPPLTANLLREDYYDSVIQELLGDQWREQFSVEMDDLTVQIRRALGQGLLAGDKMPALQRRVRDAMGVVTDRRRGAVGSLERAGYRANFNRVQTLTRTLVATIANNGALAAYKANRGLVDGYAWLTAEDEMVCPQCAALDGKEFGIKLRFRPPLHPNCRCTLTPIFKPDVLIDPASAPQQTLLQWSAQYGMAQELDTFMNPKQ